MAGEGGWGVTARVRCFDVEDRPVAVLSANSCFVFKDGQGWRLGSVALARKALIEGIPLSFPELARQSPAAIEQWPRLLASER